MSTASHRMTRLLSQSVALAPSRVVWILVGAGVVGLWPTVAALARIWRDMFDYQHGGLVAAITVIWLWRIRRDIDASSVRPVRAALPLFVLMILGWTILYRASSELMQQLLLPVMLLLAIYAAAGPQVCRRAAPPLAYFYFAIPIWDQLVPLLQWLTTAVAESLLGVIGVPTQVEGHHVTIPSGRFSIIEGCSGQRFLVIALAFAALAGAIEGLRWRRLLPLFAVAVGLALVTNWLRVVTVIYAGHVTEMQHYLVAQEHKSFGYALFIPLLLTIMWMARRMAAGAAHDSAPRAAAAERLPQERNADWLPVAILSALPILVWAPPLHGRVPAKLAAMSIATGAWQGPLPADSGWQPRFVGPAQERRAAYDFAGSRVEVYFNVYTMQTQGRELIFHGNSAAPADRYTLIRRMPSRPDSPPAIVVAEVGGQRWLVAQSYKVGGWPTASPGLAQLYYGLHAIVRPVPAGTLATAMRCEGDCSTAAQTLDGFWREHSSELMAVIPDRP
jgi:EpsI family protein